MYAVVVVVAVAVVAVAGKTRAYANNIITTLTTNATNTTTEHIGMLMFCP